MKKRIFLIITLIVCLFLFCGCEKTTSSSRQDTINTINIGNTLVESQPTPTDIDYSLERYNLIRRTYWVNGQREKARMVPCPISDVPMGYIVFITESGTVLAKFVVDGKITSLNSYLTPDSEYYEGATSRYSFGNGNFTYTNRWLPDVDGSYGANDGGIFFFTPDGKYIEWNGIYMYSDIPFNIDAVFDYTNKEK